MVWIRISTWGTVPLFLNTFSNSMSLSLGLCVPWGVGEAGQGVCGGTCTLFPHCIAVFFNKKCDN